MDNPNQPNWEKQTIEKIALAGIKEQRCSRRWGIFFKAVFFIYLTFIIWSLFFKAQVQYQGYDVFGRRANSDFSGHIALVRLSGVIIAGTPASAATLNETLYRAMDDKNVKGVLLLVNSPGGAPAQSSEIYKTIRALKEQYNKPIYTAVSDVCTSGCYYIASATDEIYADRSSIVGSIGVISQTFGYAEAAKKIGLDPRTFTAGSNKDFLNPSKPLKEKDVMFIESLLNDLHQNFISAVKKGRGDRLSNNPDLFSGLFWVGDKAKKLGLIDGFATPLEVAKKMGDYPVYDYTYKSSLEKFLVKFGEVTEKAISGSLNHLLLSSTKIDFK